MFGKSASTRWQDTIHYLNTNFPCAGLPHRLGDHIHAVVPPGLRDGISKELSLGRRKDGSDDPKYGSNTNRRHALRGLLLCQRVYFSHMWAMRTQNRTEYVPVYDTQPVDWKDRSLLHWGNASEQDLLGAIGMFAPLPNATAADVSEAAKAGPPSGSAEQIAGCVTLTRNGDCCIGASETCYRGVLAWLLKSGVISLRWFMKDVSPNGQIACDRMFGTGVIVWDPKDHFDENSVLPHVEQGFLLHMWTEQMGIPGWNGHWVVSNGDGTICGVNNGIVATEQEQVLKAYTKNGLLRSQFKDYGGYIMKEDFSQRGKLVPKEPKEWARAKLVKFDPLTLPNRM